MKQRNLKFCTRPEGSAGLIPTDPNVIALEPSFAIDHEARIASQAKRYRPARAFYEFIRRLDGLAVFEDVQTDE